jgi:hypothetical protein
VSTLTTGRRRLEVALLVGLLTLLACGGSFGTVTGTVTDPDGRPILGAEVLTDPFGLQPVTGALIGTTAAGVYNAPLENGLWQLTVSAEGFQEARKQVYVPSGGEVRVDFVLRPAP